MRVCPRPSRGPLFLLVLALGGALAPSAAPAADPAPRKKVAAIVADWFKGSHPDVLFNRVFQTYTLDGKGLPSQLELSRTRTTGRGRRPRRSAAASRRR